MEKNRIIQYNGSMYYRRTKYFFQIFFSQFAVGVLILVTGLAIVYYSQGYRLNFKTLRIMKTGVIVLSSLPKDSNVLLNGAIQKKTTPFAKSVSPGFYGLSIRKDGFANWENWIKVAPEIVYQYSDVVLFKKDPMVSPLSDQNKINLLYAPTDILAVNASDSLGYNEHEIWVGSNLVTRFSQRILRASWYPDMEHIVFQEENQIRIIEKTGTNDTLLVTLSGTLPTVFAIGDRGQELYFRDGNDYKVAQIR